MNRLFWTTDTPNQAEESRIFLKENLSISHVAAFPIHHLIFAFIWKKLINYDKLFATTEDNKEPLN